MVNKTFSLMVLLLF